MAASSSASEDSPGASEELPGDPGEMPGRGRAKGPERPGSPGTRADAGGAEVPIDPFAAADNKACLVEQVEAARAAGFCWDFDGRWQCADGQMVMMIGNRLTSGWGPEDWNLRPFWRGSRRLRATVEGKEMTAKLTHDSQELIWSDGEVWRRIVGGGPGQAARDALGP